jgi:hypothetical protein
VDSDYFSPGDVAYDSDTIAFVGRMDYYPNQECMIEFCASTLPKVQAKRPGLKLLIVGADPTAAVQQLGKLPGVTVTGSVPDVRPYLRRSALLVAPLNIARGTQKDSRGNGQRCARGCEPSGGRWRRREEPGAPARCFHAGRIFGRDPAYSRRPGRTRSFVPGRERPNAVEPCMGQIDATSRRHYRALPFQLPRSSNEARRARITTRRKMDISIFGLGYVGAVSLACLARDGHRVIGVDVDQAKLDLIAAGRTPVVEEGMVQLMADTVASGRVTVTRDVRDAVMRTELSLICVGTPSAANGSQDQSAMLGLAKDLGAAMRDKRTSHVFAFRSTLVPGTVEDTLRPIIEFESGKKDGSDFHICFQPEFLREGSSIKDYDKPPYTIVGANAAAPADLLRRLFGHLPCALHETTVRAARWSSTAATIFTR